MKLEKATIIVLRRTNYGEADRIVNAITSSGHKVSFIVKGVRKLKSKLVPAAELFTVSEITYVIGKSDIHTVSSARIIKQYSTFLNDIEKVQTAYDILKLINKQTADSGAENYFDILNQSYEGLEQGLDPKTVELWACCQVLREAGRSIRLNAQVDNQPFSEDAKYNFDHESGGFLQHSSGVYKAEHVKLLKLSHSQNVNVLGRVNNCANLCQQLNPFIKQFVETSL